jgi:hypothetical protein
MATSQLGRLTELEEGNARLKRKYAELSLVHHALKEAAEKKSQGLKLKGSRLIILCTGTMSANVWPARQFNFREAHMIMHRGLIRQVC